MKSQCTWSTCSVISLLLDVHMRFGHFVDKHVGPLRSRAYTAQTTQILNNTLQFIVLQYNSYNLQYKKILISPKSSILKS